MDFTGKNVLIAGGAGFIGTNLALALAARNARLRLTIHEKPLQALIPGAEILALDLRRPEHCAQVHITPNVLINTLMLEAAHRAKVARFCFISSGAAYPPTADRPVREAEMFDGDPHDVYFAAGWMKRYAEILCRTYAEKIAQPMPTVVVRPSNVYGPYDKFDFNVSHVTAALIRRVVERQSPLEVWGTGEDIRDLIYVDDFIDGTLAAFATTQPHLAINICSGIGRSVRQIVQKILVADGYENADVRYDPSRPSTIPLRLMDNSAARRQLGFEAKTSLEEGLRRTIQWYRTTAKAA
jgi:GDP-L-fucose synthase